MEKLVIAKEVAKSAYEHRGEIATEIKNQAKSSLGAARNSITHKFNQISGRKEENTENNTGKSKIKPK